MTYFSFDLRCVIRKACVALASVILFPMVAMAADAGMNAAYLQKIKNVNRKARNLGYQYALCDIDEDGTPELLIIGGTCEADMALDIYTWHGGKLVHLDNLGAGHGDFSKGNNCLIFIWGQMDFWSVSKITKNNLKLENELLAEGEFTENDSDGPQALAAVRSATAINWHGLTDVKQLQGSAASKSNSTGKRRSRSR